MNLHYEELVMDKSHDQLLASQLQTLLVGFDVYLETEVLDVSASVEIPKEKVIPRVFRSVDLLGQHTHDHVCVCVCVRACVRACVCVYHYALYVGGVVRELNLKGIETEQPLALLVIIPVMS